MRFLAVFVLVLLIAGCNSKPESPSIEGTHLSLTTIPDYLPSEYQTDRTIVFRNAAGDLLSLQLDQYTTEQELDFEGQSYTSDVHHYTLQAQQGPLTYRISLSASANYTGTLAAPQPIESLLSVLTPTTPDESVIGIFLLANFQDGEIALMQNADRLADIELFDTTFIDVLRVYSSTLSALSELIINSDVGVVAFRDLDNELWVFDHFE